jgi:tripartite-type tricarboxylate transporter receptor subunit TctC
MSHTLKKSLQILVLLACSATAFAQAAFPSKPIRVIVPFPAGGPLDGMARVLGQAITPILSQPVLVDNRPGALGTIGSEAVARSPADGYTVLAGFSGGHSVTPAIMTLRFDPVQDLPPLAGVARSDMVLVAGANYKGQSLQDFVKGAKARKDVNIGAIGTGSTNHLVGGLFQRAAGFSAAHVPYQGAAPLATAVMAGQVDFAVLDVGAVLPHIASGKLVALAVANASRSEFLPSVPTTAEAGYPAVVSQNLYCLFLPAGTPKDAQEKLHSAFSAAGQSAAVKEQFGRMGLVPTSLSGAEVSALIAQQRDALVPVARDLKIRID